MRKNKQYLNLILLIILLGVGFFTWPAAASAWNLKAFCSVLPTEAFVGETITWTASQTSTAKPGDGTYFIWSWSGDDGLNGTSQSVQKIYQTAGVKKATILVTLVIKPGKTESSSATCEVTIKDKPPATLKVIKQVINTGGGNRQATDFIIHVKKNNVDVASSPAAGSATGNVYQLSPGDYVVSESNIPDDYEQTSIGGDCSATGAVTLNSGDNKVCVITNTYKVSPPPPALSVICAVSPNSAKIGDTVNWHSQVSGGTGIYTYNWSGTDGLSGQTAEVVKSYSTVGHKTGTVTVTSGSETVSATCDISITDVPPPPPPSDWTAVCEADATAVKVGSAVTYRAVVSGGVGPFTYSWSGTDGLTGSSQEISFTYSSAGTKTAAVVVSDGVRSVTTNLCSVNIMPPPGCVANCGGGGYNPPEVVLYQKAEKLPLAFVYLSQVPYTGFGDFFRVVAFLLGIALWSVVVVYLWQSGLLKSIGRKVKLFFVRNNAPKTLSHELTVEELSNPASPVYFPKVEDFSASDEAVSREAEMTSFIPADLPIEDKPELTILTEDADRELILAEAKKAKTLISDDAAKVIAAESRKRNIPLLDLLRRIIQAAEERFVKEDGWILLNKEKTASLLADFTTHRDLIEDSPAVTTVASDINGLKKAADIPKGEREGASELSSMETHPISTQTLLKPTVPFFLATIGARDFRKISAILKNVSLGGGSAEDFVRRVIGELDRAYLARFEGGQVDPAVKEVTSSWPNERLEEVIAILLSIVDQNYKNRAIGIKLAALRLSELK
jgi:hypothetical protein